MPEIEVEQRWLIHKLSTAARTRKALERLLESLERETEYQEAAVVEARRALAGDDTLPPRDVGHEAQDAAEAHLNACWAAYEAQDDARGEPATVIESPASGPFDGCLTCEIRETLHAAWPVFERYVGVIYAAAEG